MAKFSPIRKGAPAAGAGEEGNGIYFGVKADEQADVVFLTNVDEMISINRHAFWQDVGNSPMFPCLGGAKNHCPGCELGDKPKYRAFMQLAVAQKGQISEAKIFSFGIRVARALADLDDALGGLRGHLVRIKRRGSGMTTTYSVIQLGKKVNVAKIATIDIVEHLKPFDREGIMKLLREANLMDEEDGDTADEVEITDGGDMATTGGDPIELEDEDAATVEEADDEEDGEIEEVEDDEEEAPIAVKAKATKPVAKPVAKPIKTKRG